MPPLTVFIVEDSPTIRQHLAATLEDLAPVRVVGDAADAATAIDCLAQTPPPCELAIIDVFLRQGSGLEVLAALQRAGSAIRRVVLTNYATPPMRAHCLALGAERVFDKSGEIEALAEYCETLARERG